MINLFEKGKNSVEAKNDKIKFAFQPLSLIEINQNCYKLIGFIFMKKRIFNNRHLSEIKPSRILRKIESQRRRDAEKNKHSRRFS